MDARDIRDIMRELVNKTQFAERRRKKDWISISIPLVSAAGWVILLVALALLDRARPAGENFITRYLDVSVIGFWNTSRLRGAFTLGIVSLIFSAAGLILNSMRKKRKTDRYRKSLIALCAASVVFTAVFLIRFTSYL